MQFEIELDRGNIPLVAQTPKLKHESRRVRAQATIKLGAESLLQVIIPLITEYTIEFRLMNSSKPNPLIFNKHYKTNNKELRQGGLELRKR